jgi:hypothetical protein
MKDYCFIANFSSKMLNFVRLLKEVCVSDVNTNVLLHEIKL